MCKVISQISQKGGVGKSTVTRNLATILAKKGYKVLTLDADNQASLTDCFGIEKPEKLDISLYHLMMDVINEKELPPKESYIIRKEGVDIIPSSIELSAVEINLVNTMSREYVLKTVIDHIKDEYDICLVDCMPSLGLMTLNVLVASDAVLIPATPEYLSAMGIELVLKSIVKVKKRINPSIQIEGILLNMFEERTNLSKSILDMISDSYGEHIKIFNTRIPKSVRIGEANLRSMSIVDYMPEHKAAKAYESFVEELINVV
jgi:chromosome partitioning protein